MAGRYANAKAWSEDVQPGATAGQRGPVDVALTVDSRGVSGSGRQTYDIPLGGTDAPTRGGLAYIREA